VCPPPPVGTEVNVLAKCAAVVGRIESIPRLRGSSSVAMIMRGRWCTRAERYVHMRVTSRAGVSRRKLVPIGHSLRRRGSESQLCIFDCIDASFSFNLCAIGVDVAMHVRQTRFGKRGGSSSPQMSIRTVCEAGDEANRLFVTCIARNRWS
jgi:hypothetical protein